MSAVSSWENDVLGYLRHLASHCRECLRRDNCDNCVVPMAKHLIDRAALEKKRIVRRSSFQERCREICAILDGATHPLRAREIALASTCSRNLKWWTLDRMVKNGMIHKTFVKNSYGRHEAAYSKTRKKRK